MNAVVDERIISSQVQESFGMLKTMEETMMLQRMRGEGVQVLEEPQLYTAALSMT